MMKALLSKKLLIQWLISKESMSPKKLQKMLYYEYAWFLVFLNNDANHLKKSLFNGQFQAWVHGPVEPNVYYHFRNKGYNDRGLYIQKHGKTNHFEDIIKRKVHNRYVLDNIRAIYNIYHKYNGAQLAKITHRELPWLTARKGLINIQPSQRPLDNKLIYNYYNKVYSTRIAG